jgi:hypothetical protein
MKLLFFRGRQFRSGLEELDHCSEVLGDPFGNRSLVNVIDDAATYFLCMFAVDGPYNNLLTVNISGTVAPYNEFHA